MGVVDPLGGEQKRTQLRAVETAGVGGVDLGPADVLGGVGGDPAVDVGEAVEAADRGQPSVDGGRRRSHPPELVVDAVQMAIWRRRPPPGQTVAHSDHGSGYTSGAFGRRLRGAGLLGSMGSIGDCFDNRR